MKLDVRGLPQGPSEVLLRAPAERLELHQGEPRFEGDIEARLSAVRHQDNILIKGTVSGRVVGECARCLEPFGSPLSADFTLYAERAPEGGPRGLDRELESDQYLAFHDGMKLDLGEEVREALLLALPIQPLCRADCRGLCPGCGANLNTEPCRCAERKAQAAVHTGKP